MLVLGLGMLVGPERALAQRPIGIDVSHWQGTGINWVSVKASGVTFAYCKATEGVGYTDNTFTINEANAKAAGVLIGGYHFARYDGNTADAEAAYFWGVVKNYVKEGGYYLMPMLDLENIVISGTSYNPGHWGYTKTTFSQWVNAWCMSVSNSAAATGITIKPVIYTSSSFAGTWLDSTVTKWTPWIANWNGQSPQTGSPSPWSPWSAWTFWQYSDAVSTPGAGTVDGDVFNGTLAGLAAYVIGGTRPGITNQPASQIVLAGANVTFTVGVSGSTPFSYQWRFNGGNISGATASSYTRNNAQTANAGSYSVVVTNNYGSTNSANAVLTVHAPPIITAQPTNTPTGLGLSVTLSVSATGDAPLSYQWRRNGGDLTGATTSNLTITNAQATNAGTYAVVVTNVYGTATSSNALLTVSDPYITNQPQSQTVASGAPATFTVGAVGTPSLSYSWSKNDVALVDGANISGSKTATLSLASVQVGDVGTYSVTVSNVSGSVVSSNATLVAAFAPSIVTQPASQKVLAGSTVSLSVSLVGPEPMTSQWRKDGTNLVNGGKFSGTTTTSLVVSNVQIGECGNYSLVASNTYGATTSSNALLSLWPLAAWGRNDYAQTTIPGGLSNVVAVAGGLYHSLASRADGTVTAWGAGMTNSGTSPQLGQAIVPSGLSNVLGVAAGGYHSLALRSDGTVTAWGAGTANTGVNPHYGQAIVPPDMTNAVDIVGGGYHSVVLKADGTVGAWGAGSVNTGSSPDYGQSMVPAGLSSVAAVVAGGYHTLALKADGTLAAWGAGAVNTGVNPDYGQSMVPAGLSNVVMIAAGGYHSLALKADGTVVAWGDNTYGQATVPAGLTNVAGIAAGRYFSLALKCDGTLVAWGNNSYNQTNTPATVANVVGLAGGGFHVLALESDGRPALTTQPVSQTVPAGATVVYAAMAVGSQPLSYQWQFNGTNIPGATASVLSLANVQLDDAGAYALTVSNAAGTVASSDALLTVLAPPVISGQPSDEAVIVGAPVIFSVAAAGSPPLGYQWQFNSADIAGATQSSYSLVSAQPTNEGTYSVVVSNAYGTAVSSNAVLTVLLPPSIITQPSNQTVVAGASMSFTVQAASSAPLNYQWYFGQTNLLAGADTATLSLTNVQAAQAGDYSVLVNNVAGSVTSTAATLTVLVPSGILIAPSYSAGGVFQFNLAGAAGSNYVIEASTNLTDWIPLETNTSPFTFTDTNAVNFLLRFYRAHQSP